MSAFRLRRTNATIYNTRLRRTNVTAYNISATARVCLQLTSFRGSNYISYGFSTFRYGLFRKPVFPISPEPVPGTPFGSEQSPRVSRQHKTTLYTLRRRVSRTRNRGLYGRFFCGRLYRL